METFAIRLGFGSFLKLMVVGCVCGATVMAPINAFFSAMTEQGSTPEYFLLAPIGGLVIGAMFGVAGYPVYAWLSRRFPGLSTFKGTSTETPGKTRIAP